MGFFPDVAPGDRFQPLALLENNLRHLVNGVNGFTGGIQHATSPATVRIPVYNAGTVVLSSGCAVEFPASSRMVDSSVPCKMFSSGTCWGVAGSTLNPGDMGYAIVAGPAQVSVGGASSSYVEPIPGGSGGFR